MSLLGDDWGLISTLTQNGELEIQRNEIGTRLIGHDPRVAPRAYRHIVYAPLKFAEEQEFISRSPSQISAKVLEFLRVANGMVLNFGDLRVLGYVPIHRQARNTIHNYPPNIMVANDATLERNSVRVGYYKEFDAYAVLTVEGAVRLGGAKSSNGFQKTWDDYKIWIVSETRRLADCSQRPLGQ